MAAAKVRRQVGGILPCPSSCTHLLLTLISVLLALLCDTTPVAATLIIRQPTRNTVVRATPKANNETGGSTCCSPPVASFIGINGIPPSLGIIRRTRSSTRSNRQPHCLLHAVTTTSDRDDAVSAGAPKGKGMTAPPPQKRTGMAQRLLDAALASPLWKLVLVPQARASIAKTAEANGINFSEAAKWIQSQDGPWKGKTSRIDNEDGESTFDFTGKPFTDYPHYYRKEFHAYDGGNLCWDAAFEQELAGRAVGARNFPQYGESGEDAFRDAFDVALEKAGAFNSREKDIVVLDLGCGTGTSTRRMAERYPHARKIIGMDLSPYFIEVGQMLLDLAPTGHKEGGPWVTTIRPDERIELIVGDAASTGLLEESVDVVNVGLMVHELPPAIARAVVDEALRILKPGGQIWISEMDFQSPAYAAQRANALLFSLIRATEPYLDEYAESCSDLWDYISDQFESVRIEAATGRHYALVASKSKKDQGKLHKKAIIDDQRYLPDGSYAVRDTHLQLWESKTDT